MNTFAKSLLSIALGLGMSTSAFAQSGPSPKAPAKSEVSKAAPAAPMTPSASSASSASAAKVHDAKTPAKKSLENKAADSAAVKPAEVKKSDTGTVHTTGKDLSKHETAKPAK